MTRDMISSSSGFQFSFVATPTEEEERNIDDIINNNGRVSVGGGMANKEEKFEGEEREKKEDFVKAVDDLLEMVTKRFSRISRDMLGKSTSPTHPSTHPPTDPLFLLHIQFIHPFYFTLSSLYFCFSETDF